MSAENRRRFMKVKDYFDFDEFRAESGLLGMFSNQTEYDAVYKLSSMSSVYPTTLRGSLSTV